MPKISKKHHFIPEFYLNNFTNNNNQFYVYLIKEKRFKKNGNLFYPSSHFFVEDGNTVKVSDLTTDFLETKNYSPLDSEVSVIFEKIKVGHNKPKFGLTDIEIVKLNYFFAHLYWRNPNNDGNLHNLIKTKSIKDFGLKLINANNEEEQNQAVENIFKNHPDTHKMLKYWFPLATFENNFKTNINYTILPFPSENLPSLLGDNPIMFNKDNQNDTYLEELIVPISKSIIYIRSNNLDVQFHTSTKVLIDMLQLRQANNYVCCTNQEYISQLNNIFETKIKDVNRLRSLIFYDLKEKKDKK